MGYRDNGGMIGSTLTYERGDTEADYFIETGSTIETIQYVGGATIVPVAGTTDTGIGLTSLTGGIASAPRYGDLIICAVSIAGTANKVYNIAGFTQIADLYQNDTEDSNLFVGYAYATPIPQTFITVTGGSGAAADGIVIAVQVFRNVRQSGPLDVIPTTAGGLNGAIPDPPAITPTTAGSLIVVAGSAAHDSTAGGAFTASYLTNFLSPVNTAATNRATLGMGYVSWPGGAYDPAAWTFSGTGGTAANWSHNSVTMAIAPGPAVTLGNKRTSGIWGLEAISNYRAIDVQGQQEYISAAGNFNFTVPAGVTQVSAVAIGGGGGGAGGETGRNQGVTGGAGGGLAWGTFSVTPGEILTVAVGAAGTAGAAAGNGGAGGLSSISRGGTVLLQGGGGQGGQARSTTARTGGTSTGAARQGGGAGGNSGATADTGGGGGGAGGYSGNGGAGGTSGAGSNGAGGGGGGGGATNAGQGYGGGGVGVFGAGANGTGGALNAIGTAGSGGVDGTRPAGGLYGGGGGACDDDTGGAGGAGGRGAVRIIWGQNFSYPSSAASGVTTETNLRGVRRLTSIL